MITTRSLTPAILTWHDEYVERFALFGQTHVAALVLTIGVAFVLAYIARIRPADEAKLRFLVGALILGSGLGFVAVEAAHGTSWRSIAPLHLCDIAVFVGAVALFTRRQQAFELLYFWGLTGTLLAMVTPELAEDFPHHRFILYFLQHGSLVVGAMVLCLGLRMRPERGSVVRAWLWLNAVAVGVGAIDYAFDVNFLYLRAKPVAATPLDWFGEWPWYLGACEVLALGLFLLLNLPFALTSRGDSTSRAEGTSSAEGR
jgi:hypothetical integral membrane protein (TIGR02206 family)